MPDIPVLMLIGWLAAMSMASLAVAVRATAEALHCHHAARYWRSTWQEITALLEHDVAA